MRGVFYLSTMNDPRNFLPAKYKEASPVTTGAALDSENIVGDKDTKKIDSPWSDLAKEPTVPQYQSHADENVNQEQTRVDDLTKNESILDLNSQDSSKSSPLAMQKQEVSTNPPKNKNNSKMAGLLVVFFLIIGVFASYLLVKQNQDTRQQAAGVEVCGGGDPYCNGFSGYCISGYRLVNGKCVSIAETSCGANMHWLNGRCVHKSCKIIENGTTLCGYMDYDKPCTEETLGGDWCDDPNTSKTETCAEAGLLRCQCNGWWVIGNSVNNKCFELCRDADPKCPTCPKPTSTPKPTSSPKTPTPTPPLQPLACGEFNCTQNSDCQNGLTCQSVTVDGKTKKICSKGENQLFCAANPSAGNCCTSQAMPVCASIEMLDANNNLMTGNADKNLKLGDEVRFRCAAVGNQDVDFDYEFRIWNMNTSSWVNITDESNTVAKNVSDSYVIGNFGKHIVQGRICWGNDCQVWEIVEGAPTNSAACYGENAVACSEGKVCSATPAGGCPTITVNGITTTSACASVPVCRQAEGISCQNNEDCFNGYTCYQPPMPDCPAGMSCAQVMPSKYCTKQ